MLAALLSIGGLALVFGLILSYAAYRFKVEGNPVTEKLEELLPQSQCGKCGYAGCRPYADAIIEQNAPINLCTPGKETTIQAIADLLDRDFEPFGEGEAVEETKKLAVINEQECIGCTLCIQACPVDAIVGCAKQIHTVIAAECTGCELCLPPCPVDCIAMVAPPTSVKTWRWQMPQSPSLQNQKAA